MGTGERGAVRPKITARLADPEQRRELDVALEWGYKWPEWLAEDPDVRELYLARSALVCGRCGNLRSECSRDDGIWYPQRSVCNATAARELTLRQFHAKHGKTEATPDDYHPADGVTIWMSDVDLTPDDDFL